MSMLRCEVSILTQEEVEKIHCASLKILEESGNYINPEDDDVLEHTVFL